MKGFANCVRFLNRDELLSEVLCELLCDTLLNEVLVDELLACETLVSDVSLVCGPVFWLDSK
jgi:hypothetical protein